VVDVVACFLKSKSGSSDDACFITESCRKDLEIIFEWATELIAKVLIERVKEKGACLGNASPNDDGLGIK
jgi:hypothetical protein